MHMMHTAMKKRRRWQCLVSRPNKLLLFLLLAAASSCCSCSASSVDGKMGRIHSHLKRINKPAVRTIQSPDGDSIDCVAREQQHALDHPLLKKHKIQLKPTSFPINGSGSGSGGRRAWQTWHHVGHCPKGTVAVRRTNADDVLRVGKPLSGFGRKHHEHRSRRAANAPDVVTGNGHEHAIAYTQGEVYYGAKATINVWDPSIQEPNGFSLSQLWILSGSFNGSDLNSIEAGWQVSPALYGDSRPRLFTYWTSDAYEATGCYNALCPGFIQTSPHIAIGASISPVSSVSGNQYDMTLLVWKDPRLGNWWLSYGGQLVGYWPAALFTHLGSAGGHASMVEWGGEVVNTSPGGAHTATHMGSGRFASQGFGKASYFRNLETVDAGNSLVPVPLDALQTLAEDAGCYDINKAFDDGRQGWGTHFYYGGPGHNPACP
ncbi:uncharacterized protein LOC104583520 isoform X4 [Brachypodium distachyon]|uniref:Neprosin PEP catalytic domain-containing protein n=1 Tax=Brachypodium distachyon TaxID=15368 RepID=A0A0Q3PZ58_BRADI|nr:uncharacterized protein LOC104583520 isoform X4 [Brachypodium distachyon]KQJ94713.1 hypothetical protein BRADI_3g12750v3 [Brachypodium distachyon]|eukprot:XP_010234210.1 uncharacterized protein LOC104583520 isoform X4 [Brachypodium distachyon]